MKLKLVFILITIYTVPLPAMMNKLRLHHARSVRDRSGNQIKVDKPVKVDKSVPGIFCEHFCPDIDYKIIDSMTVNCGEIDFANTCKGMNSLAQVNKLLNEYMNHDQRTLYWIKQLSEQFGISNSGVARSLQTKGAYDRYLLQTSVIPNHCTGYCEFILSTAFNRGLDLDFTYTQDSLTMLMWCLHGYRASDENLACWFLKKGADINACDKGGKNACMLMLIDNNSSGLLDKVLNHPKLHIDHQDGQDNTALHHCINGTLDPAYRTMGGQCKYRYRYTLSAINILLARGANPLLKNNKNKTPLEFALRLVDWHDSRGVAGSAQLECPEIIEVLRQAEENWKNRD